MHIVMVIRKKGSPEDISYAKSSNTFIRTSDGIKVIGSKCSHEYDYKDYEFEDVDFWVAVENELEQDIYVAGVENSWLEYFGIISLQHRYYKFYHNDKMLEKLLS